MAPNGHWPRPYYKTTYRPDACETIWLRPYRPQWLCRWCSQPENASENNPRTSLSHRYQRCWVWSSRASQPWLKTWRGPQVAAEGIPTRSFSSSNRSAVPSAIAPPLFLPFHFPTLLLWSAHYIRLGGLGMPWKLSQCPVKWLLVANVGWNQIHSVPMISKVGGDGSPPVIPKVAIAKFARWRTTELLLA